MRLQRPNTTTLLICICLALGFAVTDLPGQERVIAPEKVFIAVQDASFLNSRDGRIRVHISNGEPPYKFFWYGPDGFVSDEPNLSGIKAGMYSLEVRDSRCAKYTDTIEVRATYMEVTDGNAFSIASIRPNPFVRDIEVRVKSTGEQQLIIDVFASNGDAMLQRKFMLEEGEQSISMDLSDLASGIYILKCCNLMNCSVTERIIKMD